MNENAPTMSDWRALYQAALEFKEIEAWTWMYDSDVFGVQDPVSGEIGYCCVMGALGEIFALAVYLGSEGLASYFRIADQSSQSEDMLEMMEIALSQKCLMASFGARKELTDQDRQVIKSLGLKFRGKTAWPLFRSYCPAYFPWYLTADEAKFLTLALQQAKEVCLRFREDQSLFEPPREGLWFVKVPKKKTKRGLVWEDAWLEPAPFVEEITLKPIEKSRLTKLKKTARRVQAAWETDWFFSPIPVQDEKGERPYYPYMMMVVDHMSGFILGQEMMTPEEHLVELADRFVSLVEMINVLPAEIWVRREVVYSLLEPFTSYLGIRLRLVDELSALREAQRALMHFMGRDF